MTSRTSGGTEYETTYALRVIDSEAQRHGAAHRVTDDHRTFDTQRVEECEDVAREEWQAIAVCGSARVAVPSLCHSDDVLRLRELGQDALEGAPRVSEP